VNVPELELQNAERKCNILSEIEEDFHHVIRDLERRYGAVIRVQIIRAIVGGGAGRQRVVLSEVERVDRRIK
jgi:hypothetical protein